jgi:hypothetical protein
MLNIPFLKVNLWFYKISIINYKLSIALPVFQYIPRLTVQSPANGVLIGES